MHGTFRRQITIGAATTVRFDANLPANASCSGSLTLRAILIAAGCGLAVLPGIGPTRNAEREQLAPVSSRPADMAHLAGAAIHSAIPSVEEAIAAEPELVVIATAPIATPSPLPVPPVEIEAPSPALPVLIDALEKEPVLLVELPAPAELVPQALPPQVPVQPLRPVDVEQIAESEVRALQLPQSLEPGLAAGSSATLAARIDAMQVTIPPPPRLAEEERAALLAEAPTQMMVRIGDSGLGEVAFRTSEVNTVEVQLAGLLDLLVERFDSSEFERLRNSTAADNFVGFDQLRALGLNLRYDPVYDELRIAG